MKDSIASVGSSADIKAGVQISKVHGGYFSNEKNAEIFCKVGLDKILKNLQKKIILVDFGGGEGFLTKHVADYLTSRKYQVEASVLDANNTYLEIAKSIGLKTIFSSINDSKINNADLIIARAIIHYNSPEKQQEIFDKIFQSLKSGGYFVHQLSSGSKENCKLRSDLVNLKSLGRAAADFKYKWLSEKECLSKMKKAGFKENFVAGYATANSWTSQEQWDRFNKKLTDIANASNNKELLKEIEKRKSTYLKMANRLIEKYLTKYNNKDNDIEKTDDNTYLIKYTYPILISRK